MRVYMLCKSCDSYMSGQQSTMAYNTSAGKRLEFVPNPSNQESERYKRYAPHIYKEVSEGHGRYTPQTNERSE